MKQLNSSNISKASLSFCKHLGEVRYFLGFLSERITNTPSTKNTLGRAAYLRAKSRFLVKVALHEVTIFTGCDLTPQRNQTPHRK